MKAVAALVALAAVAAAGCSRGPATASEIEAVSLPPLDGIEEGVRAQLQEAWEAVDAARRREGTPKAELAALYGKLGMLCQAYDLGSTAKACYRNAEALAADFRWTYYLAHTQLADGEFAEARSDFERVLELDDSYAPAWIHIGRLALEDGNARTALQSFERALELDPDSPAAMFGLGRAAALAGDDRRAADWLERALESAPAAGQIHYALAMVYRDLGDVERAQAHLERRGPDAPPLDDPLLEALHADLRSAGVLIEAARASIRRGDLPRAVEQLEQVLAQQPGQPQARLLLALVHDRLGSVQQAQAEYLEAVRLAPDDPRARYGLGGFLARRGQDAQAIEELERAIGLDPALKQARFELAKALERTGRPERALDHYRVMLEAEPLNAPARLRRAFASIRLGRHAQCVSDLEQDIEDFPEEPAFRHVLARLLAASPDDSVREPDRALGLARELKSELPNDPALAETTAMALAGVGRFDEAAALELGSIAAAERAGLAGRVPPMRRRLELYRSQRPCLEPWSGDEAVFRPTPEPAG